MQHFYPGFRVRYADGISSPSVPEGHKGTVTAIHVSGNAVVDWDEGADFPTMHVPAHFLVLANDFAAGWNLPGYSPDPDNVSHFDTPAEAWSHLAEELDRQADSAADDDLDDTAETNESQIEQALQEMDSLGRDNATGTVYSPQPGHPSNSTAWWVQPSA